MIRLTRLSGSQFVLNSDLIERVDSTPDTVITLVDGTKYIVAEDLGEVTDLVIAFRRELLAESWAPGSARPRLAAVRAQRADASDTLGGNLGGNMGGGR